MNDKKITFLEEERNKKKRKKEKRENDKARAALKRLCLGVGVGKKAARGVSRALTGNTELADELIKNNEIDEPEHLEEPSNVTLLVVEKDSSDNFTSILVSEMLKKSKSDPSSKFDIASIGRLFCECGEEGLSELFTNLGYSSDEITAYVKLFNNHPIYS